MENDRPDEQRTEAISVLGCLIPTFWMLIGNGILALCAVTIAVEEAVLGVADVVFWLTDGCMVGARFVDIRYFNGRTSDGRRATMADWRRYAVILLLASAAVWIGAHLMPGIGL